mgnify:CR=1 FL=1
MEEKSRILKKAEDDKSRPVSFKDSFGGSESQLRLLLKYLPDERFKDINPVSYTHLTLPTTREE